jgi:phosphoadenosine phosphosulfate reductase
MFDDTRNLPTHAETGRASGEPEPVTQTILPRLREGAIDADVEALNHLCGALPADAIIATMLRQVFPGRIALVSSFGTESAVLLDLVAQADPATPVLFLDTGKLFPETLTYRDALVARLGLTDVRVLRPDPWGIAAEDGSSTLWRSDADRCCHLRKVVPLQQGLRGFDAWITGRKRFQGGERQQLSTFETDDEGRIKVNPLAGWTPADIETWFARRGLPRHPLEADGFRSIGCAPCTDRVKPGEDARAGRWRHSQKTECGIHNRPIHRAG